MLRKLPRILVVDDQFARNATERTVFLANAGLAGGRSSAAKDAIPYAEVTFCSGQRDEGGRLINDYDVVRQAVRAEEWALVLLDVQFDSGTLDTLGRTSGQAGDDIFGFVIRQHLRKDFPDLPVVMLTSKKQAELTDTDTPYLSKRGLTSRDVALTLLRYGRLSSAQLRTLLRLPDTVIAEDPASLTVFLEAFIAAANSAPVLILGETGSGKDVLARYIHDRSNRAEKPFLPVNVATITEALAETELFGHKRGSFTGAVRNHSGLFVLADGGTLFLDEIGDMPLALQAKVLRALQGGEVIPVGGGKARHVDVRIIAATSRNLAAKVRDAEFREDLLRRITGSTLIMPPLRERPLDIELLALHFLASFSLADGKEGISFAPDALDQLRLHPFVGNVGELRHIVQNLVNRKGNHSIISAADAREALAASYVSSAAAQPAGTVSQTPSAPAGLAELAARIATWPVSLDDPSLQGGKHLVEKACQTLLCAMAGAVLERFRDHRKGVLNRQAAMQYLTGDLSLKGKGPGRVINEILGRKADTAISDDDLEQLVREWSSRPGRK